MGVFEQAWQRGQEDITSDLGFRGPMNVNQHLWALVPSSEKWRFGHLLNKYLCVLNFLNAGDIAG